MVTGKEFVMDLLFADASFAFEGLRALGYAPYGGADIGEMVSTAARIPDGDEAAWYEQWRGLAERVSAAADASDSAGRAVSAREAYLRASNYYRLAQFYLRDDPDHDPRVKDTGRRAVAAFARAAELLPQPLTRVNVPYGDTTLPGWWVPADPGTPDPRTGRKALAGAGLQGGVPQDEHVQRPVLLFHGGYDSTGEELYFAGGAGAARRGYHVLLLEGPGQGSALSDQHLRFRPDWEVVISSAVDWLLARGDVDPDAVALMGMSMGGLLAPRAASVEHRLAALVAYDGLYSMPDAIASGLPDSVQAALAENTPTADERANAELVEAMAGSVALRWTMNNGMWTFGEPTPVALLRAIEPYTIAGVAARITCPTLVLEGDADHFVVGQNQAGRLVDELTAPTTHHVFHEADGAGQHCQEGAMSHLHQVIFDWLDNTLSA